MMTVNGRCEYVIEYVDIWVCGTWSIAVNQSTTQKSLDRELSNLLVQFVSDDSKQKTTIYSQIQLMIAMHFSTSISIGAY